MALGVAISRAVKPLEEKKAKGRQKVGGKEKASGKLPEASKGRARDKVPSSWACRERRWRRRKPCG